MPLGGPDEEGGRAANGAQVVRVTLLQLAVIQN